MEAGRQAAPGGTVRKTRETKLKPPYRILNVAVDPEAGARRRESLEAGGFNVVSATNMTEVEQACDAQQFDAVILGHAIPRMEKRRISTAVREYCDQAMPIVAVFGESPSEAEGTGTAISADQPQALLDTLHQELRRRTRRATA